MLRDSPVDANDEFSNGPVAVGVSDKDRSGRTGFRTSGGARAFHDDDDDGEYRISEKERLKKLETHLDFEIFKTRERVHQEERIEREKTERENVELKRLLNRMMTKNRLMDQIPGQSLLLIRVKQILIESEQQ